MDAIVGSPVMKFDGEATLGRGVGQGSGFIDWRCTGGFEEPYAKFFEAGRVNLGRGCAV
jgi:hypothetical protein